MPGDSTIPPPYPPLPGTYVSLKEYFERVFDLSWRAVILAKEELAQSLRLARESIDQRLVELNQLRKAYETDRDVLARKETLVALERSIKEQLNGINSRIDTHERKESAFEVLVENRLSTREAQSLNMAKYWSIIISVVASVAVGVILHFIGVKQ